MPYFLISEPFIAGADFFEMVEHYMAMLRNIKDEIITNTAFAQIKQTLIENYGDKLTSNDKDINVEDTDRIEKFDKACKSSSAGFNYATNLFFCTLLFYYDRFHNFDPLAVKKLFTWAMMIRVDMRHLGFDTINRYATGIGDNDKYSNTLHLISMISHARRHTEISSMKINIKNPEQPTKWEKLYKNLYKLNRQD